MIGLVLASSRTDSIPCSLNTCAFTAAHACTSPQPTMSSGPWVLESAWDRSHTSTAYPWLKEPRPRACEHSTRWEDGKTELTISSMGRWQGGTWKSIINCSRVWFMITLDQFLRISHSLSCPLATRVRFGDASVICSRSRLQSKITPKRWSTYSSVPNSVVQNSDCGMFW